MLNAQRRITAQTPARIFLADQRPVEQTNYYRIFYSRIRGVNDSYSEITCCDTVLRPGKSMPLMFGDDRVVVLIPLIGDTTLANGDQKHVISVEEALLFNTTAGYSIVNFYEKALISFMAVGIPHHGSFLKRTGLPLNSQRNRLHSLTHQNEHDTKFDVYVGKYEGRCDDVLLISRRNHVHLFVIGGVFEVQNRLLEERDGLFITDIEHLEFEALSTDAILLVVVR